MPPYHAASTSRALYRVFVAPNLQGLQGLQAANLHATPPAVRLAFRSFTQTSSRHKTFSRKDSASHKLSDAYILDNAIKSPRVNLINAFGTLRPNVPLDRALESFNRITHHLVQVSPGRVDKYGDPDPMHPPTCKVTPKLDLRLQHKAKLDRQSANKKKSGGPVGKSLELNWAISGNDLRHRLERMRDFLEEGRRVEVLLGPKKRGKKATEKECKDVIDSIQSVVGECNGAKEIKEPSGKIGGVMTMFFQGKKSVETKEEQKGRKAEAEAPSVEEGAGSNVKSLEG